MYRWGQLTNLCMNYRNILEAGSWAPWSDFVFLPGTTLVLAELNRACFFLEQHWRYICPADVPKFDDEQPWPFDPVHV